MGGASGAAMSLDFLSGTLDPRITFSRGSNATLVDATGKIVYAPANLITYSEQFDNAAWADAAPTSTVTVAANNTTAPDGTSAADKLTAANGGTNAMVRQAKTLVASTTYTGSVFVKASTSTQSRLLLRDTTAGTNFADATLTWAAGVPTVAGGPVGTWAIIPFGNGWYRVTGTGTSGATASPLVTFSIFPDTSAGTNAIFAYGAQLEPVTYQTTPSPYVATTASAYYGPRFDYDPVTLAPKGLLIEEARTNLLIQSEAFDTVAWGKTGSTISVNVGVAPSGATTADKIVEDTSTGVHEVSGTVLGITAGQNYATTFFLKADGRSLVRVMQTWNGTTDRVHADFDLTNGTVGSAVITGTAVSANAPVITSFDNGWYRCQISGSCPTGTTLLNYVRMMSAAGVVSYTGNGASGVQIYGGQAEAGSFATSYITTVASTVSRSADVPTMTGTNFSSWYNQSEGTFVVNASYAVAVNLGDRFTTQVDDGTANNRLLTTIDVGAVDVGGARQATVDGGTPVDGLPNKLAFGYKANDFAVSLNGAAVVTDTSGTVPTVDRLTIGSRTGGSSFFNGHIRSIAYYNTRLPNAQLQSLTA